MDDAEKAAFASVVSSLRSYRQHAGRLVRLKLRWIDGLRPDDRALLLPVIERLGKVREKIQVNASLLDKVAAGEDRVFVNSEDLVPGLSSNVAKSEADMDRVYSVLKQLMREWSSEGYNERREAFQPIVLAVEEHFGSGDGRDQVQILVPGSGLGRLPWELAMKGFSVEGMEKSYLALLVSNFVLNYSEEASTTVHPFLHVSNNVRAEEYQLRSVEIPDVDPRALLRLPQPPGAFSMCAGDFLSAYEPSKKGTLDVVATCYFIDTANNILSYIRRISWLLKPGGLWVNLGPLLYHYADMFSTPSVELTLEEVVEVVQKLGFEVKTLEEKSCCYTIDQRSMLQTSYRAAFFTAIKAREADTPQ